MQKAVFMERDGVINEVHSKRVRYVNKASDVYLLPGAGEAILALNEAGYKLFIVTNQGGIGLHIMKERDLIAIHLRLLTMLSESRAAIDDIAYCPHRPNAGCSCRKPKPGMIKELAGKHRIDLAASYMIGDMDSDIAAGLAAGTRTIRVSSAVKEAYAFRVEADITVGSLREAVQHIIGTRVTV